MAGQFNLKFNGKLGWQGEGKGWQENVAQTSLMLLSKGNPCDRNNNRTREARKDIVITVSRHATHSDTALLAWSLAGNNNNSNNEEREENHLVRGEIKRRRNAVLQLCS